MVGGWKSLLPVLKIRKIIEKIEITQKTNRGEKTQISFVIDNDAVVGVFL